MSVDVFGRQLHADKGARGSSGIGFKLTIAGNFDIENKKLCNIADPTEENEAVNLKTLNIQVDELSKSLHMLNDKIDELLIKYVKIETLFNEKNHNLKDIMNEPESVLSNEIITH